MGDSICNDCAKRTRCDMAEIGRSPLAISTCYGYEKGNPSNADRIRAMTDEELAETFEAIGCPQDDTRFPCAYPDGRDEELCQKCWLNWLKQEVSDET